MRSERRALAVLVALASLSIDCGPSRETVMANARTRLDELRTRASFDLRCAGEDLEITPIKEVPSYFHEDVPFVKIGGVRGCGQQATYIFDEHRAVWILDSGTAPPK